VTAPLDDALVRVASKLTTLNDVDGLCGCGCGEKTSIATGNDARNGAVRGRPRRFLPGHNTRLRGRRSFGAMYVVEDRGHDTPCWIWKGGITGSGYGAMSIGPSSVRSAHVVAYEMYVGTIPVGLVLDHLCRVRICCNPEHLEAVTQAENARRGATAKLTHEQVDEIRRLHAEAMARPTSDGRQRKRPAGGEVVKVAERFGVHRGSIANIWNGRTWIEGVVR
jgi:hypothetical protein